MIVGLTGGIGSGKSVVADMFARKGAVVIDTDAIAREVVEPPSAVLDAIRKEFGVDALDPTGSLDRDALAKIVFTDEAKRRRLNELTHPEILKRVLARIGRYPPSAVVVVVVPLLFESGFDRNCQTVVAVVAPEELRMRRVMARDGSSRPDVLARMQSQLPEAEYEKRANLVVRNDRGEAALGREVDAAWSAITRSSDSGS
jgi:dephospho-CoA kinase